MVQTVRATGHSSGPVLNLRQGLCQERFQELFPHGVAPVADKGQTTTLSQILGISKMGISGLVKKTKDAEAGNPWKVLSLNG